MEQRDITLADLRRLARVLVEVFAHQRFEPYRFERYWPLAKALEVFAAQAQTELEQVFVELMREVIDAELAKGAKYAWHDEAASVLDFYETTRRRKP